MCIMLNPQLKPEKHLTDVEYEIAQAVFCATLTASRTCSKESSVLLTAHHVAPHCHLFVPSRCATSVCDFRGRSRMRSTMTLLMTAMMTTMAAFTKPRRAAFRAQLSVSAS